MTSDLYSLQSNTTWKFKRVNWEFIVFKYKYISKNSSNLKGQMLTFIYIIPSVLHRKCFLHANNPQLGGSNLIIDFFLQFSCRSWQILKVLYKAPKCIWLKPNSSGEKTLKSWKKFPLTKDQQAKTVLQIAASECFCFWTNNCGVQIFTHLCTSWSLHNKAQFGTLLEFSSHHESALSFGY